MNDKFASLFDRPPIEINDGDYYYFADIDGDQFNEEELTDFAKNGRLKLNWERFSSEMNSILKEINDEILCFYGKNPVPFMEIACGPGMGLTPLIIRNFPRQYCLATDACSNLIKTWRKYLNANLSEYSIDFASFSVMDVPIKENSLDLITSYIGLSSTRSGESGEVKAISEVYRVLKPGGYFIGIENEWTDFNAIEEVFGLWGRPMWNEMKNEKTWTEKFTEAGFNIESNEKSYNRYLTKDDNELGEEAHKHGIKIGMKFTLFILRK